jgi:hypothetical protein
LSTWLWANADIALFSGKWTLHIEHAPKLVAVSCFDSWLKFSHCWFYVIIYFTNLFGTLCNCIYLYGTVSFTVYLIQTAYIDMCWVSSVNVMTKLQVGILAGIRFFSSWKHPDWFWGHPASYPVGTGSSFHCSLTDHSPPSKAKVKNAWICHSTSLSLFMAWCLIMHGDNFPHTF